MAFEKVPYLVRIALALGLAIASLCPPQTVSACPFCAAVTPTLVQRRENSQLAALGEITAKSDKQIDVRLHYVLHQAEDGKLAADSVVQVPIDPQNSELKQAHPGWLVLAMHEATGWTLLPVDETAYAYVARSPSLRTKPAERLAYFARFLEHSNPLIAEDAYMEFGHAPLDQVRQVADRFDPAKLSLWILDPQIPGSRKGFYGLALGLSGGGKNRQQNLDFLQARLEAADDDFRAGFDGILGGYLLLGGKSALAGIDQHLLTNPKAANGDVRHAMTALRFFYEFGTGIPKQQIAAAMAHLVERPEFAAAAIVDLARWEDWGVLDQVAAAWPAKDSDPQLDRAIVGYLVNCPLDSAAEKLKEIRHKYPQRAAQAAQFQFPAGTVGRQ